MAVGQIPPWIKPADEADYLGRGLQIGASMAAQQAQEEYRQQQMQLETAMKQAEMARQAQQDELAKQLQQQQQARLEKQFALEAKQAAEKSQALLGYQQAVNSGEDPLKAMLTFGPGMGQQISSAAAAMRAQMAQQNKPQIGPPTVAYADFQGKRIPYLYRPGTTHFSWMPSGYADTDSSGSLTKADTQELGLLKSQIARAEADQSKYMVANKPTVAKPDDNVLIQEQVKQYQKREADLQKWKDREQEILSKSRKEKPAASEEQNNIEEKKARARELRDEHPDWSKEDIINQVNTEYTEEFADAAD